jgi:hypothetical protein
MSFHYSPKIITDGLVLYMDAANPKSYSSGSTTWNDLSRSSNNGTLTNGVSFDTLNYGSLSFDGVDDRVSKVGAINTGQNFTVNAWIYPTLLGTTRRAIVGNGYPYSTRQGWLFCTAGASVNNTFFMSIGGDLAYRVAAANTLSPNIWQYVTAVVTDGGLTISLYKNGQTTNTSFVLLSTGTITYNNTQFNIGFRNTILDPDPYTGKISIVTIYNRALTQQEIIQNYNANKTRFGLT